MNVKEVMTRDVITVPPTASLKAAASLLVEHRISGLPVVENDRVVGVFSERDLLFKEQGRPERSPWLSWLLDPMAVSDRPKLDARYVGAAMTAPAITIDASASVATAARRMLESGVSRLPVLKGDRLVGLVTRADLVRAFARDDEEIAREIRDQVVRRSMWLEDDAVQVDVRNGVVTLHGRVKTASDARLIEKLVELVPGVVSVGSDVDSV